MAEGRRPGGLTALAVINFIFGGIGGIGILLLMAVLGFLGAAKTGNAEHVKHQAMAILTVVLLLGAVNVFLLIASGVGYLQQKRVLGRYLGNTYGVLGVVGAVLGVVGGRGFGLQTLIGLIYPVLTLILLNTTFKEDLVN